MRSALIGGLVFAGALCVSSQVRASDLYGATYLGAGGNSSLYSLNQTTGAATLIGAIGTEIGDMTNIGGQLVGINISANRLYNINNLTGAAGSFVQITGTQGNITSIAWDKNTNTLFGNTTSAFSGSNILYRINTSTGVATLVGNLTTPDLFGLGFGQTETLFASNTAGGLWSVNTSTAALSLIGNSGVTLFDLASRPEDNVLFGTPDNNQLVRLNTTTGASTSVGPFGASLNIAGLAFLAVPEPATWAAMVTGFALVGAAFRRRQRQVTYA